MKATKKKYFDGEASAVNCLRLTDSVHPVNHLSFRWQIPPKI